MQTNTKNPPSSKTQNQELFHVNSLKNGCSVTSVPIISNFHFKNERFHVCRYYKSLSKIDTHPRNNALSLV